MENLTNHKSNNVITVCLIGFFGLITYNLPFLWEKFTAIDKPIVWVVIIISIILTALIAWVAFIHRQLIEIRNKTTGMISGVNV